MTSTLGYWKIRGMVTPIRLILAYAGEQFEDKYYETGPAPDFSRDSWLNEKFTLGLDFPNLPYYIDGDLKLTQSGAILRYLARKHNLNVKTEPGMTRRDMMLEEVADLRRGWSVCYDPNFEKLRAGYVSQAKSKMAQFDHFLGDNQWFTGDSITFVDFVVYDMLDCLRILEKSILDGCDKLQAFVRRFEAVPAIKPLIESDKYLRLPLNNKQATFGGTLLPA